VPDLLCGESDSIYETILFTASIRFAAPDERAPLRALRDFVVNLFCIAIYQRPV
jgi:hypothetical protein